MKLNPDCTRAVLLAVEEVCDMHHYFSLSSDREYIKGDFSDEEIAYHIRQCELAGMLYKCKQDITGDFSIIDLSPAGHEFLANIREDSIWNKVKSISAMVGSKSLSGLAKIASSVITELIRSQFGLH